jgi:NhaA family Na+:H+ antiporter
VSRGETTLNDVRKQNAPALLRPFQEFFAREAAGAVLLMICTGLALAWANSPWAESYVRLWETKLGVSLGGVGVSKSLHHWINDGLMAVFFFVVGLEIKREFRVGELASARQAALPLAAAVGGMVVPALLYSAVNAGGPAASGWGVPMATDIAFALGVLSLLGPRVPLALKVFLAALAIVDDLGAVLVIAIFYTDTILVWWLGVGAVFLLVMFALNRLRVRHPLPYAVLGAALWFAVLESGVHATIAGVLAALVIPARRLIDAREFAEHGRILLAEFAGDLPGREGELTEDQRDAIHSLEVATEAVQTPSARLEHMLHPWVAFFVMPVFALANAGVPLGASFLRTLGEPAALGTMLGLVVGKPLGVGLFAWLALRTGLGRLPAGVSGRQVLGAACLCGIGFTMSLFIADLEFETAAVLESAKAGILSASVLSGLLGWTVLRR